jgi:hypothetical protein
VSGAWRFVASFAGMALLRWAWALERVGEAASGVAVTYGSRTPDAAPVVAWCPVCDEPLAPGVVHGHGGVVALVLPEGPWLLGRESVLVGPASVVVCTP